MKKRILFTAICLVLPALFFGAAGQEAMRDFRFVTDTNPYITLGNPAAISFWNGRIATAEVSFDKHDGGLRDIHESSDSWQVTAGTESYCRISDLIAFHGQLAWSDFSGKAMGGPIMIDPSYNPVSFYESTEETLGTKQREMYSLCGEIALNLGDRWGIGLGVNYQAGDQTKIKDPRFSNIWMDLQTSAGVTFRATDILTLGTSLLWRNTLENVKGHIYGTTDTQYFIYTDRGCFLGTVADLKGDYAYIPDTNLRPMNNDWWGASLQAVIAKTFSNEFSILRRAGYYGKKSSSTPTFFEFGGIKAEYKGLLTLPSGNNLHRGSVNLGYETLSNSENLFRYSTPEGGNTVVEYTGQNPVSSRKSLCAALDWRWYGGIRDGRAATMIGFRGGWTSTKQTTVVYPFWRIQAINKADAELFFQKNIFAGSNIITADISAYGLYGYGDKDFSGEYVTPAATTLLSFDNYLDKHYEAETAPRAGASLGFTYTRIIGKSFAPWIKIADSFTSLVREPEFIEGRIRNIATVSIGCNF